MGAVWLLWEVTRLLSRLKIRTRLALMMAVPLLAVTGVAVLGFQTMQAVKVEGPSYAEIIETKELVSDVSAPPEFLVESFLVVRQLATETDPGQVAVLTQRLDDLQEVYEERHEYWEQRLGDEPSLRFALLSDSYAPAQEFWTIVDEDFLPSVADGDTEEAQRLVEGPLQSAYERHDDAVSRVTRLAAAHEAEVQAETSALIDRRTDLLVIFVAVVAVVAVVLAALVVRSIRRPLKALERNLPRVADELQSADLADGAPELELAPAVGHDELAQATQAFNSVVRTAVDLAAEQARIQRDVSETYLHLGRRNQNLLRRMLSFVSDLEQNERDAEALDHLFRLDHLATRMRRNAESLLVLAGAEPARTWSTPVPVIDVVRAAISEIEDFGRIDLAGLEPAAVLGTAASDVTHLLAELLENAASFSPPSTQVEVHGRRREDGYVLSIVDHGLGMTAEQLDEAQRRVTGRDDGSRAKMLGLHVVGRLAGRHDLQVQLADNPSGGTVALVWLPFGLVGPLPGQAAPARSASAPASPTTAAAAVGDRAPEALAGPRDRTPAMAGVVAAPSTSSTSSNTTHAAGEAPPSAGVRLPTLVPPAPLRADPPAAATAAPGPTMPEPDRLSGAPAGATLRSRRGNGANGDQANGVSGQSTSPAGPPAPAPPGGAGSPGATRRSADEVRSNLARLQAGVRQARHEGSTPDAGGPR